MQHPVTISGVLAARGPAPGSPERDDAVIGLQGGSRGFLPSGDDAVIGPQGGSRGFHGAGLPRPGSSAKAAA